MSADWFIDRAVFLFAEDRGCSHRKIAVGRTMPDQQNKTTDWIFPNALGGQAAVAGGEAWSYYREPYGAGCKAKSGVRIHADEHTRPYDHGSRPVGLRPGQGFYLDLVDGARPGPRRLRDAVVYTERQKDGRTLRLSYWMLYGRDVSGGVTREGDWEQTDVLLRQVSPGRYEPSAVVVRRPSGPSRTIPWRELRTDRTHPLLVAERGSHTLSPAAAGGCKGCLRWPTWTLLAGARNQLWFGFGGAWGEAGRTGDTTGPLGPHGTWAEPDAG